MPTDAVAGLLSRLRGVAQEERIDGDVNTADDLYHAAELLAAARGLETRLIGARAALASYAYGNASPQLAQGQVLAIDDALATWTAAVARLTGNA